MSFSFGSSVPKTTVSTILGTPTNTAAASTGFSLGTPTTTSGLAFGTPPSLGFSLGGAGDSKSSTGFASPASIPAIKPVVATAPFSLASTPTTLATPAFAGFSLTPTSTKTAATLPTTTTATGFSFGSTPTCQAATSATPSAVNFSLTSSTTTTPTTSLKLGIATTTTSSLAQSTLAPASTTLASSTVASAAPAAVSNINFVQLEENLKKWDLELEEQEKVFIGQAVQINNWDTLLNSNSDKIVALNEDVEKLRLLQQQLDNELDFVVAQQKELEEVLGPLEQQVSELSSTYDPEREHLYHMSESLDTQLKQMSEDLREIIDNVNESNQSQDNSDPIVQIGRILNAQMGSLQWIDQMTLNIQNQLENVTKLHDTHRRENERSFRISYE